MKDWITAFEEYTSTTASPQEFRKWTGIACVAGALERKRWVYTAGSNLYPNLYIVLVGPPGVGKTHVLKVCRSMWGELPGHKIASSSVSKASLMDDLAEAGRVVNFPGQVPPQVEFHSLKIMSSELGVFLPDYANEFMSVLTDLYDCEPYAERKRSRDLKINLDFPQLNFLAGTTPSYLNSFLPQGAWDQGFLSRTLLIYSGEQTKQSLFTVSAATGPTKKEMVKALREIAMRVGEFRFTEKAAEIIDAWHMNGGRPAPDHPKLRHYLTRRTAHALKLCQVSAASRFSEVIEEEDVRRAIEWLIDMEVHLPDIFKAMRTGGDTEAIEECWHFLMKLYMRKAEPIQARKVFNFLQEKVPAHTVERIVLIMEKAGLIKQVHVNKVGECYVPLEKHEIGD